MHQFQGTFYDGRSAIGRACTVSLEEDALDIRLADGTVLWWPFGTLALISEEGDGDRVVVAPDGRSDERLTLQGAGIFRALLAAVPALGDQRLTHGYRKALIVAGCIVAVLVLVWLGYPVVKDGVVAVFPASWSDRIGREMVEDQAMFGKACTGEKGLAALDGLARRLSEGAGLPEPVTVHVRSSSEVNAFAVTGGHVALLDGLIKDAKSPEEIAGVLAHEIGHVQHRHPLKRLIDVAGIQVVVTSISGDVGAVGTTIMMLEYGRDDEAQADAAAVTLLDRAGIGSAGLADFFDRMATKQEGKPRFTAFLRTHPPLADRSAMMRAHEPPAGARPALTEREWQDVRAVCDGVAKTDRADRGRDRAS